MWSDINGDQIFNTLDILLWIAWFGFWYLFIKTVGKGKKDTKEKSNQIGGERWRKYTVLSPPLFRS